VSLPHFSETVKITFLKNHARNDGCHDLNIMGYHDVHSMAATSLGLSHKRQWILLWYRLFCVFAAWIFYVLILHLLLPIYCHLLGRHFDSRLTPMASIDTNRSAIPRRWCFIGENHWPVTHHRQNVKPTTEQLGPIIHSRFEFQRMDKNAPMPKGLQVCTAAAIDNHHLVVV
jgi:hypothetical protein